MGGKGGTIAVVRRLRRRPIGAGGLALLLLLIASGGALAQPVVPPWRQTLPPARPRVTVDVGGVPVVATLARTGPEQELGLGYRDGLKPGTGMLFVYDQPAERVFWMKGMRFCLDIIWVEGGAVAGAAESVCPSPAGTADVDLPVFQSPVPVTDVLEVPAGFLRDHGLGAGSPVTFTLPVSSSR